MKNISPPHALELEDETEAAPTLRKRRWSPGIVPGKGLSIPKSFDLSRPWHFPAAHADFFIRRRFLRARVQVPVEVSLSRADGSPFDAGTGVVRDLSYSGLCIDRISLPHGLLLAARFGIELRSPMEPSESPPIAGRILRTHTSGLPCFGIEFLHPEAGAEGRLQSWG